ncbi:hypothetical protein AB0C84_37155 [Actinomadura sp. NPDC048955]|uniref:hypothetical protein n=1 Tax=Actinomadura sp. NPDC048955 TaxID=3158228 RepID=UPI0033F93472
MGIEQSGGIDTRVAGTDKPSAQDQPPAPPPDRPGQPGTPSRLESLRAAREAQLARAAELESRQPAPPETGTEQPKDKETKSSPIEGRGAEVTKTAEESTEPEVENGEPCGDPDTGQTEGHVVEKTEVTAEDPAPPAETEAAKDIDPSSVGQQKTQSEAKPEATDQTSGTWAKTGEAETTETSRPGDAGHQPATAASSKTAGERGGEGSEGSRPEATPQSSDALAPLEVGTPQEEGQAPGIDASGPETAMEQVVQDAPAANQAMESEEGDSARRPSPQIGEIEVDPQGENRLSKSEASSESPAAVAGSKSEIDQQLDLGAELAQLADEKVDTEIDQTLSKINPNYDAASTAYSENCTGVVQANELRRRGHEVAAGPLEKPLRSDEGGPGGRPLSTIEQAWGGTFTRGTKAEIEEAFKEPGARGIIHIAWNAPYFGSHVFSVENVGGKVRFVDGQPKPPVQDAEYYFTMGHSPEYLRVDDRPTPPKNQTDPLFEP